MMVVDLVFPFADYWWLYAVFTVGVLGLLALDPVFHRDAHEVSIRESAVWSVVWVVLALAFNYGFYLYAVRKPAPMLTRLALEFLAGYVVEKALAVDNVFVFVMVFGHFAIPRGISIGSCSTASSGRWPSARSSSRWAPCSCSNYLDRRAVRRRAASPPA
ncbi:MAG: hypothetical protein U0P30_17180 [Vicinamibacterales bacterium]